MKELGALPGLALQGQLEQFIGLGLASETPTAYDHMC